MKYSICIDAACKGIDSLEALDIVKASGFKFFEFWQWQARDIHAVKAKADSLGLKCVTFSGKRCNIVNPQEHESWLEGVKDSIKASKVLQTGHFTSTVGNDTGARREFQHKAIVDVLKAAAPILAENGVTMFLEPLNGRVNHIGTYLESSDEGFRILDEVGSPNIKLLFDIYHQQITEGDALRRMLPRIKDIGHLHSAGSQGRHELDNGELNYRKIFDILSDAGYDACAGLEYFPEVEGDSLASLKRMYAYLHD